MLGSRLNKGKVLGTPHLYCTQWDPSLILGLVCVSKESLCMLLILALFIYL